MAFPSNLEFSPDSAIYQIQAFQLASGFWTWFGLFYPIQNFHPDSAHDLIQPFEPIKVFLPNQNIQPDSSFLTHFRLFNPIQAL